MQTNNNIDLKSVSSELLAKEIVKILLEKKGIDVTLYDVRDSVAITDFYVNVTARSSTHVASLADDLDFMTSERGRAPERIEGKRGNNWILVDYIDVIVNIFDKTTREFYNLERLLPAEGKVDTTDLEAEVDKKFDNK